MGRALVVVAMLAACGDDSGSGTTRDGGGSGSDGGGGAQLFSGTGCEGPVSYTLGGDERLELYTTTSGTLDAFVILDGQVFDTEDQAAWQTYGQTNDTLLVFVFGSAPPVSAPQTITHIFDSFVGGRNMGTLVFAEGAAGGASIQISALDTAATTISFTFTLPVVSSTQAYPPTFDAFVDCAGTLGSITGSFSGPYELKMF